MTSFQRINSVYKNAEEFKVSNRLIDGFSPVVDVRKTSSDIFRILDDELDDSVTDLRIAVWRLKSTIELSVLPFNSKFLQLRRLYEEVQSFGKSYPNLNSHIEKLAELVEWFLAHPDNPKLNEISERMNNLGSGKKVGVAARLVRGRIPGWDESGWLAFQSLVPECQKIISVATLRKEQFDIIIVPSGGISIPFRRELFTSFASPEVLFVSYGSEAKFSYRSPKLPQGSLKFTTTHKHKAWQQEVSISSEEVQVEEWFDRKFWEITRNNLLMRDSDSKSSIDNQFKVKSRLALLGEKKGVYFREDHKVIEISDIIEGRIELDGFGKKYPRKSVKELQRGDLVVLRTAGSGDALDDVAESLMMSDKKFELIEKSCEWKMSLHKILENNGTDIVATMLARYGHQVRDPNYLWMWTTRIVIKPEEKNTFIDLIKVIKELGDEIFSASAETYACEKWEQMRELIKYRMQAGQKIREALLQTLREFIKKGVQIEDEHHISLTGVGGGELTIFRISGMDEKTQFVPYSKTGVIGSVET